MNTDAVFIGELARRAGVNRETLRFYERLGLLAPTSRTRSGYRLYDEKAARRLHFIKQAQTFGFTLEEIAELLALRPESATSCETVVAIVERKLEQLRQRLKEMKRFHAQLSRYRTRCRDALEEGEPCPLIVEQHELSQAHQG